LTSCQFRIRKVISDKNDTLMVTTLLNKHTKFGAKIFKGYWVTELSHVRCRVIFLAAPCRDYGPCGSFD